MHQANDFVQVKTRRKRNRSVKKNQRHKFSSTIQFDSISSRDDVLRELFDATVEIKDSTFKKKAFESLTKALDMLDADDISQILCYGLGSFSYYKSSMYQLAFVLSLKKRYNCPVYIYDPSFRPTDIEILQTLDLEVIKTNEEGKRVVNEQTTLVYMPHCAKQLSNNFLYANWSKALTNCILLTNSFSDIMNDNIDKNLSVSAGYIYRIYPYVTEIRVDDDFRDYRVFSGFNIQIFTKHNLNNVPSDFWTIREEPTYREDVEFILAEKTAKLGV